MFTLILYYSISLLVPYFFNNLHPDNLCCYYNGSRHYQFAYLQEKSCQISGNPAKLLIRHMAVVSKHEKGTEETNGSKNRFKENHPHSAQNDIMIITIFTLLFTAISEKVAASPVFFAIRKLTIASPLSALDSIKPIASTESILAFVSE